MPGAITDKLTKASNGTRPVPTTLNAILASGAAPGSANCAALTGWPTDTAVHFIIYTTDANGDKVAGSQTDWKATVNGSNLDNLALKAGTNTGYSVGAIVEAAPTAAWADDLVTGLLNALNQDGTPRADAIRTALGLTGTATDGWNPAAEVWTYGANNGNKEFTVTMPGNTTSIYQPGMRVKIPRTVTPPTQSMAFSAASSQYASKVAPTGISFTDDFTIEAWIYVVSYPTTGLVTIIRQGPASNGWGLRINTSGQLDIFGGAASSYDVYNSRQSVPTNRWIHVAATADMSGNISTMYLNGISIATYQSVSGPAALVQSGDLYVGRNSAAADEYFTGYISELRVWPAIRTQAQIRDNMAISLVGNEGMVVLYQGNGNFNDKTANANNLTAAGGAIATQPANPYNATEYGIITKAVFSASTTLTLFMGTDYTLPATGGLGAVSFSSQKSPYGFNSARGKWRVESIFRTNSPSTSNATYGSFVGGSWTVAVPTGDWVVGWQAGAVYSNVATDVAFNMSSTALTGLTVGVGASLSPLSANVLSPAAAYVSMPAHLTNPQTLASISTFVMYTCGATAGAGINGITSPAIMFAECAWV